MRRPGTRKKANVHPPNGSSGVFHPSPKANGLRPSAAASKVETRSRDPGCCDQEMTIEAGEEDDQKSTASASYHRAIRLCLRGQKRDVSMGRQEKPGCCDCDGRICRLICGQCRETSKPAPKSPTSVRRFAIDDEPCSPTRWPRQARSLVFPAPSARREQLLAGKRKKRKTEKKPANSVPDIAERERAAK